MGEIQKEDKGLMVSIRCLTYNQAPYIRQCLDGFVMQQTDFRFEAIVHDDASTDGTADIVREYAEKYPDIIKPVLETENQYSKHDGSLGRIVNSYMHGKYVAMCEGDDYWTDPHKLQKQVDFLEANPDYFMCFHNAIEHFEDNIKGRFDTEEDRLFSNVKDKRYKGCYLYKHWIVPTASIVMRSDLFRSEFYKNASQDRNFMYGDIVVILSCAAMGKVRGLSDVMSVYRRHAGGVTLNPTCHVSFTEKFIRHSLEIRKVFGRAYRSTVYHYTYKDAHVLYEADGDHHLLDLIRRSGPCHYMLNATRYRIDKAIKFLKGVSFTGK